MKYLLPIKIIIMKKILFLSLIFSAIISTTTYAQPAGDPPSVLQQMKEQQKPGLIEKAGLTEAQANKLIEINYETRMAASNLKDLSEADRSAKISELKAAKEKKIAELLTPEQILAVKAFYEEMGKNRAKKPTN
jgi:Spy/CpxP family protein refolding chaperone